MGWLNNIFRSKPKLDPINFSVFGTDVHSHLIPGIDDGAKTLDDSIELIKKLSVLGFQRLITTPHVMSDFYRNTPTIIKEGLAQVTEEINRLNIPIKIEAAAEYYLDDYFEALISKNQLLTFGKNYVLFELSFQQEPNRIKEVIFALVTAGYQPILAHVERYPFYFNQFETLNDLRNRGVIFQLNINSLSGQYGPQVKKMAEELIDKDWIDLVGSDCHHMAHLQGLDNLRSNRFLHKIAEKPNLINKIIYL